MFSPKLSHAPDSGSSKPASRRPRTASPCTQRHNALWQSVAMRRPGVESVPAIQAKLTVGARGDKYEQEADRVADRVMRMPVSGVNDEPEIQRKPGPSTAQRVCTGCAEELQRQSSDESEEEELQMSGGPGRNSAPSRVSERAASQVRAVQSGGEPMARQERSFLEPRFGRDFRDVRIQSGARANSVATGLGARAFTVGNNITFAAGQYRPDTADGKRLLAHELTHVVQQTSGSRREPQRAATGKAGSQVLQHSPPRIARQEPPLTDEADTFVRLNGLSMKDMLEKFAAMDESDLDFLLKHVDKHKAVIHEERMKAALLVAKHRGSVKREDFAKSQEKLLGKVNADQVSLILDHLSKSTKRKTEINIYFSTWQKEAPGFDDEFFPIGHMNFYKRGKLKYSSLVSGGGHLGGLTDRVRGGKIHRKQDGKHRSSNGNVPMPWPIYFKGRQAIHQGDLDHASLSCVHVPDIKKMEKIHGDTAIGGTVVNVYYKQSVLDKLCPLRVQQTGRKINPCN